MADAQSQPDALALADSVKFAIQHRDEEIERLKKNHSEYSAKQQKTYVADMTKQRDKIERLTARNEKLEAVYEAAKEIPRFEDTMPSLDDPKLLALDKALDRALDAVQP